MPYTITRDDADKDARYLRDALQVLQEIGGGINGEATLRLEALADSIEEQVKPAIEEPTEFGSIVRASTDKCEDQLWTPAPYFGEHYWVAETRNYSVWSDLIDVEVLRIGVGDPIPDADQRAAQDDAYLLGVRETATKVSRWLRQLRAEALTAERQNAYDKAIKLVEELVS